MTGTATLDFGAFPGKSDASVVITGQAWITANSLVEAWIQPVATADHSADEHMCETLRVFAGNIVPGVGFTIYGVNTSELNETPLGGATGNTNAGAIGQGTRIYGAWSVAWVWI